MPVIPPLNLACRATDAPHVVILGAGASLAAFPNGEGTGRQLPLMRNLAEVVGLKPLLHGRDFVAATRNFEEFYDELVTSERNPALVSQIEHRVSDYFGRLQLPIEPTLYDYIVLSLREKDLIATFNWDPLLPQAYRRNAHAAPSPQLAFLHGNVDICVCHEHRAKGFRGQKCPTCHKEMSSSRLLYPVRRKNYSADGFIKNEWDLLRFYLGKAYWVTIFGYSAPATDVEARKLMLDVWAGNAIRWLAQIEIVDVKARREVENTWQEFMPTNYRHNLLVRTDAFETQAFNYVRRSCDALAMATLQQEPFSENPFPSMQNLPDLHSWLRPLVREEETKHFSGARIPTVEPSR